jgi:hypothetical protein
VIGLFCVPLTPIASEQHSSLAPSLKLALLRRSVKINVVQKQQHGRSLKRSRPVRVSLGGVGFRGVGESSGQA